MNLNEDRIYASYNGGNVSLPELSLSLLAEQKTDWTQLLDGYERLASVRERWIEENDFSVLLQCNPQRIKSSETDIDPAAIRARPCFLCVQNLPPAQKAILWRRKFFVLCNPAPIFPAHFTIADIEHIPQTLTGSLLSLLQLAKDFSPFALLYNGPKCGASAPDHLHFQAVPRTAVPALRDGGAETKGILKKESDGALLFKAKRGAWSVMIVEGRDRKDLAAFMKKIIKAMQHVLATPDEPMMNLFCLYDEARWQIVIFPRSKHRPDVYSKTGKERVLISPGAVDMGGIVILPREDDFHRLDAVAIRSIISEVVLTDERVEEIIAAIQ